MSVATYTHTDADGNEWAIEISFKIMPDDLAHAVDEACFEAAEAAWELSQCDD